VKRAAKKEVRDIFHLWLLNLLNHFGEKLLQLLSLFELEFLDLFFLKNLPVFEAGRLVGLSAPAKEIQLLLFGKVFDFQYFLEEH